MGRSAVRGIRGAITVSQNSASEILQATRELLIKMAKANHVKPEDIASIVFSATPDLDAAFPAAAARDLGWTMVPLFDTVEIAVPGAIEFCVRILLHINTELRQSEVKHIYLREARLLRQDLTSDNT